MKCTNCGTENPSDAVFCSQCGQKIKKSEPIVQPPKQEEQVYNVPDMPYNQPQGGSGMAVASMVCGILSLVLSCCIPYVPFVLALIGVILGGVSLHAHNAGRGMAIAGLVTSIISLVPAVIVVAMGASLMAGLSAL
ncbi:MAG: DUF4190 domain-containing protein [Lachnoclostridium sp.]|uniref:DUF4190 domain-containing protein n=1 Tax=uncultured Clostridium sp. TaxID=59620 RepID=UPI00265FCE68|nr:DUF4190 domain-containing protein [uncultured Clostridium sp.]MCI5803251.1 DUF4190 domain-containing protein [Lachnoclostridium sp.]